jgi:hypothetical protein
MIVPVQANYSIQKAARKKSIVANEFVACLAKDSCKAGVSLKGTDRNF